MSNKSSVNPDSPTNSPLGKLSKALLCQCLFDRLPAKFDSSHADTAKPKANIRTRTRSSVQRVYDACSFIIFSIYVGNLSIGTTSLIAASKPVNEVELSKLAVQDHATADQWELSELGGRISEDAFAEKYSANFYGKLGYGESKQKSLNRFQPVFSPLKNLNVGVRKQMKFGVSTDLSAYINQKSILDGDLQNSTAVGLKTELNIDLWQNLLGSQDALVLKSLSYNRSALKLRRYIDSKMYEFKARSLYWSIVANRESSRIALKIKSYSERQLEEANRRMHLSIGDKGEVTRYRSLVVQSRAGIAALDYRHQKLLSNLRSLVPSIGLRPLAAVSVNITKAIGRVNQCIGAIGKSSTIPWKFTKIDEYLSEVGRYHRSRISELDIRGAADMHLFASLDYAGKENSSSSATDELTTNGRPAIQTGISLNIPLGGAFRKTKAAKTRRHQLELNAVSRRFRDLAVTKHAEFKALIPLLMSTVATSKESTRELRKSIEDSKEKFEQARVGVDRIIADENQWISSLLDQVSTQLTVIHEVYDYLRIFTETPCKIMNEQ